METGEARNTPCVASSLISGSGIILGSHATMSPELHLAISGIPVMHCCLLHTLPAFYCDQQCVCFYYLHWTQVHVRPSRDHDAAC